MTAQRTVTGAKMVTIKGPEPEEEDLDGMIRDVIGH
jgi:hypothetical protein